MSEQKPAQERYALWCLVTGALFAMLGTTLLNRELLAHLREYVALGQGPDFGSWADWFAAVGTIGAIAYGAWQFRKQIEETRRLHDDQLKAAQRQHNDSLAETKSQHQREIEQATALHDGAMAQTIKLHEKEMRHQKEQIVHEQRRRLAEVLPLLEAQIDQAFSVYKYIEANRGNRDRLSPTEHHTHTTAIALSKIELPYSLGVTLPGELYAKFLRVRAHLLDAKDRFQKQEPGFKADDTGWASAALDLYHGLSSIHEDCLHYLLHSRLPD